MKKLKKLLAVVMMIALMIPVTAFAAEGGSATKVDISKATTKVTVSSVTFNGKKANPTIKVTVNGKTLTKNKDYKVAITNAKTGGTYAKGVKIVGIGKYTGTKYAKLTIKAAANPVKVSKGKNLGAAGLKKKAKTCQITVKNAKGKVTYKSGSKYLKVSSKGKVTVAKGTKKGTYKIAVKVAGNKNYKAVTKIFTVAVK
ncbi:MAG: hypothetical protein K2G45_02995 [Lachnospiraceae bacterium]|nr:hypothetical protein [Lachnospiraceae bacterium]